MLFLAVVRKNHRNDQSCRCWLWRQRKDANNEGMWAASKRKIQCEGLSWWLRWWGICLQCKRPGFDPWVRKNPWRMEWLPIPAFLPGECHGGGWQPAVRGVTKIRTLLSNWHSLFTFKEPELPLLTLKMKERGQQSRNVGCLQAKNTVRWHFDFNPARSVLGFETTKLQDDKFV